MARRQKEELAKNWKLKDSLNSRSMTNGDKKIIASWEKA